CTERRATAHMQSAVGPRNRGQQNESLAPLLGAALLRTIVRSIVASGRNRGRAQERAAASSTRAIAARTKTLSPRVTEPIRFYRFERMPGPIAADPPP